MRFKDRFLNLTTARPIGTGAWRGISTIASGTAVASVTATGVVSGAQIAGNLGQMVVVPVSVSNGSFLLTTAGSVAVTAPMPVQWFVLR
jgi:hypothetical protein